MKKQHLLFALFLLFALSFSVQGKIIKVFAIGNSFSEDAVEQYLYELAAEGGDTLIIGNAYRPGRSLEAHWSDVTENQAKLEYRKIVKGVKTNTRDKALLECLTDEDWDYITFQQASHLSGVLSTYEPWLTNLIGYVKEHATNPKVKYGFHQTWAYAQTSQHDGFKRYDKNQQIMYQAIVDAVATAVKGHKGVITFVIPSGTAIQNGRATSIGDTFCRDGYHLSLGTGRYTAACTWLEVITGQNPVGKQFKPEAVTKEDAKICQRAAHKAVRKPKKVSR